MRERHHILLITGPDRFPDHVRIPLELQVDQGDLFEKAFNRLLRQIEQRGVKRFRPHNPLFFIDSMEEQRLQCLAGQVARRFRTAQDQVTYIGVGDQIANHLFETDVGGLDRPGKSSAAFQARPHERLDFRRNLVVILIQDDRHRHG